MGVCQDGQITQIGPRGQARALLLATTACVLPRRASRARELRVPAARHLTRPAGRDGGGDPGPSRPTGPSLRILTKCIDTLDGLAYIQGMNNSKPTDRAKGRIRKVQSYTLSSLDVARLHQLAEQQQQTRSRVVAHAIQHMYAEVFGEETSAEVQS